MKQKSGPDKAPAEQVLKNILRQIRPAVFGRREDPHCSGGTTRRREHLGALHAASMYYGWSKEFLEAGKRRLAGGPPIALGPAFADGVSSLLRLASPVPSAFWRRPARSTWRPLG